METDVADDGAPSGAPGAPGAPADGMAPDAATTVSSEASIDEVDRVLDQVEQALTRLDDGTYGRCRSCGAVIDDDVLAETPTAQQCPDCAAAHDD
jgi:RNA polymerase-binding transcription factor DksA